MMRNLNILEDLTNTHSGLQLRSTMLHKMAKSVVTMIITYKNAKGIIYEEMFNGKGNSEEEAKENTASTALNRSSTLQSVRHGAKRRYERRPSQTGYVLVVCFLENRDGAEKDVKRIVDFMEGVLDYKCCVFLDPAKEELQTILKETAKDLNDNTRDYFCFTLFIMGHGNEKGIRTSDDIISEQEIIYEFRNDQIQNFAGKPKAFFIQCCRGGKTQQTVHTDFDEGDQLFTDLEVPVDADIFVAYATTEGHVSVRCPDFGTVFIFNCIETFKKDYSNTHLVEMMIDVKAAVAFQSKIGDKTVIKLRQMPCTWSTLTKRFYLKPA